VRGGLQVPLAPELQGVADVADDAAVDGRDVLPFAAGRLDLQAGDVLAAEERQRPELGVCAGPGVLHEGVLGRRRRVVDHVPQVVFGFALVGVPRGEVVWGQLEDESNEGEDFGVEGERSLCYVLEDGMMRGKTHSGEFLDFSKIGVQKGVAGFRGQLRDELWSVDLNSKSVFVGYAIAG